MDELDHGVISALTRVEVTAALWRKQREGALPAAAASALVRDLEDHLGGYGADARFIAFGVSEEILAGASALLHSAPLRASDAVQLASALAARRVDPRVTRFACFDRRLRDAAAAHGFQLIPA